MIKKTLDEFPKVLDTGKFAYYVFTYIKHKINKRHTLSVVNIILEELRQDILDNKIVNIPNLGKLWLKPKPARKYYNVFRGVVDLPARKILVFDADPVLTQQIFKYIDIDKTFGSD